jgi:hypothetical protein
VGVHEDAGVLADPLEDDSALVLEALDVIAYGAEK